MSGSLLHLGLCVGGVYSMFLIWAIAQERLSVSFTSSDGTQTAKFPSILAMNTCQSALSALSAFIYLIVTRKRGVSVAEALGLRQAAHLTVHGHPIANGHAVPNGSADKAAARYSTRALLWGYLKCAVLLTSAAPFGFVSLSYISYPAMVLGKSCKLVPVMLMNIVLYRRRFAPYKYAVVVLVTSGITLFMAFGKQKARAAAPANSVFGLALLAINLLLDGATYSTQDELIARHGVSGQQMMFFMNVFATLLTTAIALLPLPRLPVLHPSGGPTELAGALAFLRAFPAARAPLLQFAFTGALGQLFIFETLKAFGSLTLVTITLTRKLVTMVLSVVVYNHRLTAGQWLGGFVVFCGITLEAWVKRTEMLAKRHASKIKNL